MCSGMQRVFVRMDAVVNVITVSVNGRFVGEQLLIENVITMHHKHGTFNEQSL